ncbi:hypothetical protein ACF08M_24575 [Streptomyces sp. NPDC015032]|uniref:hypothetical protein n=1 Tax=Streptomyces sp. NPDC015032 TaxID=3364937 RepID=UPI0036FFCF9C
MDSANDGQAVRAGLTAAGLTHLFAILVARGHVTRIKPAPMSTGWPSRSWPYRLTVASRSRTPTKAPSRLAPSECP